MDLDPQIFFQNLYNTKNASNGQYEAQRLLDSFNRNLIEEQIDSSLTDLYLPHFFHTENCLFNYVVQASKDKALKKPCMKALEILITILNNFYSRIPEKDILSLYTKSTIFFNSTTIDSYIKSKVFDLVLISLEKSDGCVDNNVTTVYKDLIKCLTFLLKLKNGDKVKGKEMELMGYLVKKFPFLVDDPKPIKFGFWYNFEMRCALVQRKLPQSLLAGFYIGFSRYLESFPLNLQLAEDQKKVEQLYRNMKSLVVLDPNQSIKVGNRAAISFLATYCAMFKDNLLKDYKFWHEKLMTWLTFGAEEKKAGVTALRAFYQSISKSLEESDDVNCKEINQYFISYCKNVLNTKETTNFEKRLAIFCLREFSSSSLKHLDKNEVTETFLFVMEIFEKIFIREYREDNENWEYLPEYVQTVAKFMRFKKFTASEFFCLQKGVISMVKSFHRLPVFHHFLVIDSLLLTMFYLKDTGYFDNFVENVIYQGVLWSCSHQHVSAEIFSENIMEKPVTVKQYFHLWNGLLKLTSYRQYDKYEFYLEHRKYILERIINELVKTLMVLVAKLNVSVTLKEEDNTLTDLEKAYRAEETNDYAIFLNVVDFYKNIFDNIDPKYLQKCVCKMIDHIISKSLKYPLTSGFYKLLSYCLKIARRLSLFADEEVGQEIGNCRETVVSFLMVLLNKMLEFKDDLLISCLQVLLETPVEVISDANILSFVGPFVNIFEVGRSYLPLAEMGVETLEYWQDNLDNDILEPFLSKIIPCLDSFLRSKFLKGYTVQSVQKRRKTMQALKKRKVLEEAEAELVKLQRKILCFIGRQSVKTCRNFIFSDGLAVRDSMGGRSSHLKVTLPYEDVQLDVHLDTFLPRIVELALYSSDRKTRITSCELLQACMMVFLGRAKQMGTNGLEELNNMLKTIVTPLLLLSCDIDRVVKQIFEPLFLQLIHWYTSPTQSRGLHTSIIIEAILEGITHPTNSNLKDFSGKCINEYVKWTLKHQNLDPAATVKVLVKNMRFLSGHPDPAKKLGAALIFNSIYRELREDEKIISIFWLEILHIFVLSLDSILTVEETTTVTQIKKALKHLQRVIIEKPFILRESDEKRRIPNDLGQGALTDVSKWLLEQTCSRSIHCRESCMELFANITPLSSKKKLSLREFINQHLDIEVASLYDAKLIRFSSLSEESYIDCASLFNYLRNLLCCIDGYMFIVKHNLEIVNFDQAVFAECQTFLKQLQNADLNSALNLIEIKEWTFTTLDKGVFVALKSACILTLLKLYNAIMHDELLCTEAKLLWNEDLWKLVANVTFRPQDLGLNAINNAAYTDIVTVLLNTIPNKLPESCLTSLQSNFTGIIEQFNFSPIRLEKNMSFKQRNLLKGVIALKNSSTGKEMALYDHGKQLLVKFFEDFAKDSNENTVFVNQLQDTTYNYTSSLFKFILCSEDGMERIVVPLHHDFYVQSIVMVKKLNFGLYILQTFSEVLLPAVCENFERFLVISFDQDKIKLTIELLVFILDCVVKDTRRFKKWHGNISTQLSRYWDRFVNYFTSSNDSMEIYLTFLKTLVEICDNTPPNFQDLLIDYLMRDQDDNHFEIFGLLVRTTDIDISENDSESLQTTLSILSEKIEAQTSNQQIITSNFTKLLTFLPAVKSTTIFEYLIETYTRINPDLDMQPLLKQFIQNLDRMSQETFLEYTYSMVQKESVYRYKIATNVMPTIFQNCNSEVFEQFFVNNIQNVLAKLVDNNLEVCTVHFILVEMLFLRIPIGTTESTDCAITAASGKPKLLAELLGLCLNAFKMNKSPGEVVRKYKCHAYNASVSIICNSVKKVGLYEKLFVREDNKRDILWHSIVNTEIDYDFPRDFDSLPTQKKILVNIRDELRRTRRQVGNASKTLQYIESQRLFNSSLSEDVTKFDFTNSLLRTEGVAEKKMAENVNVQREVYLDTTEINNHECMSTICSLVQHMFDSDICQLPSEGDDEVDLPTWMNGIRSLLLDEDTHKNVKIFLVKIIYNQINIFNYYAKWFLEPLIKFVVDNSAGNTINYFVTDVLVIISKWASSISNLSVTEARLASNLLDFFIKNLERDRQDVFKYNLELLKLIVESWKQYLTVPVDTIFEMFSSPVKSEIAVYVSSVLLVNGLETWESGKEHQFLDKILMHLDSNRRQTYRACAETLGPLLSILQAPEYVDKVNKKLNKIKIEDKEKFAHCLEGIAIKFPLIADMYHIAMLISCYNQFCHSPAQQVSHLKIIHRRVGVSLDVLEEISEFQIMNWHEIIEDSNLDIQILSLEIIKKCLTYMVTYPDFEKILIALSRNIYHPNSIFRSCLYDLAIAIYKMDKDVLGGCKELLILGLVDSDLDNQKKVSDFWTENSILPSTVINRFSFLLSELYKSKIEDKLLGLATYFLIDLLTKSDKYDTEIFEHPLEDCDFEEYKLQTNWRLQHPSVVPMFAETLDFSTLDSSASGDQDVFAIRQTQTSFQFAPTQSFQEQQLSKHTSLESTLGVDLDATFKDPNNVNISRKYKGGFRGRFLKDKGKISQMFAQRETDKKIKQAQARRESAMEKEKNVTIYRSYRKGDFPDIQIALSALLKPLQMLALHDSEISKILFVEIFKGLASKTEKNQRFLSKISDAIKTIFNSSVQFNQYLFGALLDILIKNKDKITIDSKLISFVAQESGLPSTGALLIEEYIISGIEDDGPSTSKRTFREENRETVSWIKLAELYKEIEEWDTVRAIFLEKMDHKESLQKAITYESKSLYKVAADLYRELITADESQNRRDFYYDSYFKCFANLGEWDKVPTAVAAVVDNVNVWEGLWQDEWCKQKLLPWYITSQVKNRLFTEERNQEFLENLNGCLKNAKNDEYINQHFSEELCMLWLCEKDTQTANQYLRTSVKNFLEDWQTLNPMFQSQRFQKLLKLQNVIEISDFMETSTNLTDDIDGTVNRLSGRWLSGTKVPSPSIILTETKLLYRRQFIRILTDKLSGLSGVDARQSVRELKKCKILMDIDLITRAADSGNFYMTKKYLLPYSNKDNPKLNMAKGTVNVLKANMAVTDVHYKVNNYLDALGVYEKVWTSSKDESVILASSSKFFDVVADLSRTLSNDDEVFTEYRQKLSNALKKQINVPADMEKCGWEILKASATKCTAESMECDFNNDEETTEKYKNLSNVYIKLAHFVRNKNDEDLRGDFILFVLRAMRMNSSEARQLFPCILMLDDLGTNHKDIFTREVEKIPTWMFLGWIPQLLVNVDSSKVFAVCDVIQRIAETYPQAIMYPYRLSKDNYNFENKEVATKAKSLTNRLDSLLLKDENINQFLKALSYVSIPANVLRYYVGKIFNSKDASNTKRYLQLVQEEVFDQKRGSDNVNNMQGDMFKTIDKLKKEFQKMSGLTPVKLKELCQTLDDQLKNMLRDVRSKPSVLLKNYCPWLANFSANKMNVELEVPGQYDGQKSPLPQHHVKISGFHPAVRIMSSIRKPIKLTMLGVNTKEYPFLIKFGEDIRQDQRIEQLFCLMNNILRNDETCANNGLDILTYQVIPLTSNLGLIQWINDTEPLSEFIKKSLGKNETDDFSDDYHKYLRIPPNSNYQQTYAISAEKIKKDTVVINFKSLVKRIRWDILRVSFWNLSTSTENYIALKNNFVKSYAVICVAHWFLGIGDRHLSNSLICQRSGKVLGIDFGHAFGTATQIQPVPELVPFRLTPHMVGLMEPLRERGAFRENMIHCVKCFRDNGSSLSATMNVFIQEPSIDWLEHAGKSDDRNSDNWYPLVKIEQAKRKLKGANSADIMEEELNASTKFVKYKHAYVKLVRGEENENLRARFAGREDLSVEDQVDCLLDHATDYNLLGRMWRGWFPWV